MLERTNELDKLKEELKRHKLLSYYQASQKQKQIEYLHLMNQLGKQELINKENKVKWQYLIIGIALLGIILLVIFFVVLYRQYTSKKKANVLLAEQNEEINTQKQEIESQRDMLYNQKERIEHIHSELTSSIRYAQRIQQAMLPSLQLLSDNNLQYNLMFKPRDIVSGDFYWVGKQNKYLIITVADCTGHGVPGAFMSMLGISFLNEIIRNKSILHASEILNQLRENLIQALKQNEITKADLIHADWLKDGMDISLCILNLQTNQLEYAGANNPLYILKRN
jgi:serine phosphatase RsbU (regulator of sigma subunit)